MQNRNATPRWIGVAWWVFPVVCSLVYFLVALIPLSRNDYDVSNFIVAGDRYVNAQQVPVPIRVLEHSFGYDGQFYFRLAIDPDAHARTEQGVKFDNPAWRMQRIGYPLISHLVTGGRATYVPLALFLINLVGIAVVALLAQVIRRQLDLPAWFPWAVMAWPGFIVTLVHDTTEITALVFLLGAISAYLARRTGLYVALAVATTLTRETSILIFGGIFLFEAGQWFAARQRAGLVHVVAFGAALVPYLVWRQWMVLRWGVSPMADGGTGNVGLPMVGFFELLGDCIGGTRHWSPNPGPDLVRRVVIFITSTTIVAAGFIMAFRIPRLFPRGGRIAGLALGWMVLAVFVSTLTDEGPWIDPNAYFRAFTEFWATTMILIAATRPHVRLSLAPVAFAIWFLCQGISI